MPLRLQKNLAQTRAVAQHAVGATTPVVEVTGHHHRLVRRQRIDEVARQPQLLLAVRFLQTQVHADRMQRLRTPGRLDDAMQHAPAFGAANRNIVVFVVNDGKFGEQGVAVVSVVVHSVAPIGVLVPDFVGQKFVLRHLREVGNALRVGAVRAVHFLQKHQIGSHGPHRVAQLMQHKAPVESAEALVDVDGERLEGQGGVRGGRHAGNRSKPPRDRAECAALGRLSHCSGRSLRLL